MRRKISGESATLAVGERESFGLLLYWLCLALVARARTRTSMRVVRGGITCCSLVLLVSPLALWMAWSATALLGMLLLTGLAIGVILALVWLSPEDRF